MALSLRRRKGRQGGSPNRRLARKRRGPSAMTRINMPRPRQIQPSLQPNTPAATPVPKPPPVKGPPPRTAGSEAIRAAALQGLTGANNAYLQSVWRSAMNLGDESIFAGLRADPRFAGYQFTVDPNSLYAQLTRQQTEGIEDIGETRADANTFFSGFRLQDEQELRDEIARRRLEGSSSYADDLTAFASALAQAQSDYELSQGEADQMDIDAYLAQEPVDTTSGSSSGGSKKRRPKKKKKNPNKGLTKAEKKKVARRTTPSSKARARKRFRNN